ncbi:MAG: hypothetical protein JNM61_11280 [Zoogloeaceae bacterium]|nr:hypothetical protein [Zoogloeaceae bacterium]
MHLDLAVAPRRAAEAAFFDDGAGEGDDGIPRVRLEDISELALAQLSVVLTGGYEPRAVLDADHPDDIVSEADSRFVKALAALDGAGRDALLQRWRAALDHMGALPAEPTRPATALAVLHELAGLAAQHRHALLYTQHIDGEDPDLTAD